MDVFLIEDDDLLEKYSFSDEVSADIKKEFGSEPFYNILKRKK